MRRRPPRSLVQLLRLLHCHPKVGSYVFSSLLVRLTFSVLRVTFVHDEKVDGLTFTLTLTFTLVRKEKRGDFYA